jgi:hypothetical protein
VPFARGMKRERSDTPSSAGRPLSTRFGVRLELRKKIDPGRLSARSAMAASAERTARFSRALGSA